ncbi:ABC transporter substrate-binding protein [Methanofollis fontis]|uniref:ABC transporter substrate-binding protein n=1 Tax=Methanofollis fontis TaxID=2052832 RepID=A0A483CN83_9EURY|nr:ABC transporter substrate-binding protein [Methanofollis fontis]TAJ43418.1 ABC transporter substrate-binding protein [Methanofollis fontis]
MNSRSIAMLIAMVMVCAVAFCGCTGSPSTEEPTTTAAPAETPLYVVGIDGDYPPYTYIDENGDPTGFDVESIQWIADEMGFEVTIQPMAWDGIIPSLLQGKIDMVYSGMTITPERLEKVSFSTPYWVVNQSVAVREDSELSLDDFTAGTVVTGTQRSCTANDWIETNLVETGKLPEEDLKLYDNIQLALTDLQNKRVDAVMYDVPVIRTSIEGKPLKVLGTIQTDEEYGVAIRKEDTELLATVNEGLARLMASPKWDELKQKYEME